MSPDHPKVAESLNNLGWLYHQNGNHARAESLYKRAIEIWERALGPDHSFVAACLENYADLLRKTNRGNEAVSLDQRVKEIRSKFME
ncbi:MAG: tetratricopeptide repeat protein [Candidatus Obscuribacter sp.]|nr:tetratricopeptide repeat protein [Candidatus Obscuribacter sp.]